MQSVPRLHVFSRCEPIRFWHRRHTRRLPNKTNDAALTKASDQRCAHGGCVRELVLDARCCAFILDARCCAFQGVSPFGNARDHGLGQERQTCTPASSSRRRKVTVFETGGAPPPSMLFGRIYETRLDGRCSAHQDNCLMQRLRWRTAARVPDLHCGQFFGDDSKGRVRNGAPPQSSLFGAPTNLALT